MLVHTLLVLPECLSLTSKVITLGVDAGMLRPCSKSIMLCLGGWVPRALSHSWAGAALGQEQWMPAHFPFAKLRVVFAKQRPSGSKFTFCLFLFTEDQSLPPGSTKSHGQSTQGGSSGACAQLWSSSAPWCGHAQPPCAHPPQRDPFSLPKGHGLLASQELTIGQASSQKAYLLSNSHKDLYRS